MTFVDYYKADYPVVSPATLTEHYQFYFVFLRENLFDTSTSSSDVSGRACVGRVCYSIAKVFEDLRTFLEFLLMWECIRFHGRFPLPVSYICNQFPEDLYG